MTARTIPDSILEDEAVAGKFKVHLGEALAQCMNESEWKKLATLHGLSTQIVGHPRFIRSLQWGDADHEGFVLDLVNELFYSDPAALTQLFERPNVQRWFKANAAAVLKHFEKEPDPLIDAISQP